MTDDFKARVAATKVTHDEITKARLEIVHGRIPSKPDRLEINALLGVFRDILDAARS